MTVYEWISKLMRDYKDRRKLKYVTQYSFSTNIHSESPYTDDNFLYTEDTTYILLENALGARDVKIITGGSASERNARKTPMYSKIVYPWLKGGTLPDKGDGGPKGKEPVPEPKEVPKDEDGKPLLKVVDR